MRKDVAFAREQFHLSERRACLQGAEHACTGGGMALAALPLAGEPSA